MRSTPSASYSRKVPFQAIQPKALIPVVEHLRIDGLKRGFTFRIIASYFASSIVRTKLPCGVSSL